MNLLITGGSGYVGSRLTFDLLKNNKDIKIINYDLSLFGKAHLPKNNNYFYIEKDIRDKKSFKETLIKYNIDTVLHLACISNDPTFTLKGEISKKINYDCFEDLVKESKNSGVKKFIYASTCSVYGVSDSPNVTESSKLVPITEYNKYKALCEPILQDYLDNNFEGIIIRPATVCGLSEKMRFDLSVNILTNFAYFKNYINVFGGEQYRPNIHIDDMCSLYKQLINMSITLYNGQIYNAGHQNLKIMEIAKLVKQVMKENYHRDIDIRVTQSEDIRSYQINSDKIQNDLNFKFKKNVRNAIEDLCQAFATEKIVDSFSDKWINLKVLEKVNLNE